MGSNQAGSALGGWFLSQSLIRYPSLALDLAEVTESSGAKRQLSNCKGINEMQRHLEPQLAVCLKNDCENRWIKITEEIEVNICFK